MQILDAYGRRKYLTPGQREEFLGAARKAEPKVFTFCTTLAYAGCRISEALALTASRIDRPAGVIVLESLKKRRKAIFRSVPMPAGFLATLDAVHDLSAVGDGRLWRWSRSTAWRQVKAVMKAAGIHGVYACPKALRHAFAINAIAEGIPLHMLKRWMGHADIETSAIYAEAIGPEEQQLAARMWR